MKRGWPFFLMFLIAGCATAQRNFSESCFSAPISKRVAVFIDEAGERDLAAQPMALEEILAAANKQFSDQDLPFRYDLASLTINKLKNLKNLKAVSRARKEFLKSNEDRKIDVWLFLTGENHLLGTDFDGRAIYGWLSLWFFGYKPSCGNGVIIMATNKDHFYHWILVHEQAHLYDLDHVSDADSIMYKSAIASGRFDAKSWKKLYRALLKEKGCWAAE